jgi:hypothetical protein
MQAMLMVDWICLYCYSLIFYVPATLLCLIPVEAVIWTVLAVATGLSALLVVRNVAAPLMASETTAVGNRSGALIMAILGVHVIFLLVLKLAFYHHG